MQIKNGAFYIIVKNYLETSKKLSNFEDLMNLFEEKKPNKTTLYRILNRLETASLLRIIPTTSGNKFESSTKPNHLHQICSQCQSIFCTQILLQSNISSLEKIVCKECT